MPRLSFYARGTALVTDVDAQERGIRRFVGRRLQEVQAGRFAWVPTETPQQVESHPDLLKACRDGDLWAADEATAKACGLAFDPKFDDELTETIKSFKARQAAAQAGAATPASPTDSKTNDKAGGSTGGKGEG